MTKDLLDLVIETNLLLCNSEIVNSFINILLSPTHMIKPINNKIINWHNIPWKEYNNKVQDLQNQIVKATLVKDMRLVYKLQNQLVNSIEARAIAIRTVATSSGSKTPGVDGEIWKTPEQRLNAIDKL